MTAALRKALPRWKMVRSAVLWGSVAPDLPLYLLTFGGLLYFTKIKGWSASDAAHRIFDTLYFEDPVWIGLHNFLHSPLNLLGLLVLNHLLRRRVPKWSPWFKWFLIACLFHSIVDILTHHDDGPVLLWPLNWQLRFSSPVSYWDHRHFGRVFMPFEFVLNLGLITYLVGPWILKKVTRRSSSRKTLRRPAQERDAPAEPPR